MRRNLKEGLGEIPNRRTETAYEAVRMDELAIISEVRYLHGIQSSRCGLMKGKEYAFARRDLIIRREQATLPAMED